MPPVSPVFDQHYNHYLGKLASMDFKAAALKLGGQARDDGKAVVLPLLGRSYEISAKGIKGPDQRKPGYDTCIILCRHLIMSKEALSREGEWVGFRDLKDSGPLTVYFRDNVENKIAGRYAGRLNDLKRAVSALDGSDPGLDANYDLAVRIQGLPRVPMVLLYNDAEPGFDASCSVLFRDHAETYLDAECIAMLGYRLAAALCREDAA